MGVKTIARQEKRIVSRIMFLRRKENEHSLSLRFDTMICLPKLPEGGFSPKARSSSIGRTLAKWECDSSVVGLN